MNQSTLTNTALTVLRVIVGFIFAAHGWQKFTEFTIAGTQAAFGKMGVPAADIVAPIVATIELVGGIALIAGVLTRVFGPSLHWTCSAPCSWSTPRRACLPRRVGTNLSWPSPLQRQPWP
jgi:uncharacterized membrane protein YphA (DoxX/SURF4 family)